MHRGEQRGCGRLRADQRGEELIFQFILPSTIRGNLEADISYLCSSLPSFLTWLYWLGHRLFFRENRIAETNLSPFGFGSFLDFGFQKKGSAKFVYYL